MPQMQFDVLTGRQHLMQNIGAGPEVLLSVLKSANMNVTTDQAINIGASQYIVTAIIAANASVSLTTAAGGIYTAASKGGSPIVAAVNTYSALTAASKFKSLTLAGTSLTDVLTGAILYFALTTGQGSASTADVYVYGRVIA